MPTIGNIFQHAVLYCAAETCREGSSPNLLARCIDFRFVQHYGGRAGLLLPIEASALYSPEGGVILTQVRNERLSFNALLLPDCN